MNSVAPGSACSSCTSTPSMSVSHDSTGLGSVMRVILPYDCQTQPMTDARLPDPAVVVLAGAPGSGKSTWGAGGFRPAREAGLLRRAVVMSSDALRAAVGSGPSDLDASIEAFALLDQIVAARTKR